MTFTCFLTIAQPERHFFESFSTWWDLQFYNNYASWLNKIKILDLCHFSKKKINSCFFGGQNEKISENYDIYFVESLI